MDEKRKMKGKALVMVGILVLGVGIATFGPIQVAAAYEHNWSWMLPEPGEMFNPNAGWWGIG